MLGSAAHLLGSVTCLTARDNRESLLAPFLIARRMSA